MNRVLEAAWVGVQEVYGASASDRSEVRISMVERIIEAIEAGVVDEEGLLRAALSYKQGDIEPKPSTTGTRVMKELDYRGYRIRYHCGAEWLAHVFKPGSSGVTP